MQRRRVFSAIVGGLVIFVIAAGAFLSPAIRHTHDGGEHAHSHAGTHGHSHSHSDAHSHQHGHSHAANHSDHHHDSTAASQAELKSAVTHVHISWLGFEFTLPEFFEGQNSTGSAASTNNDRRSPYHQASTPEDVVEVRPPVTFAQLVHVLMLSFGPLPERTSVRASSDASFVASRSCLDNGCLRDAPEPPPPKMA